MFRFLAQSGRVLIPRAREGQTMSNSMCPDCGHPPIRHKADGLTATCLVCLFILEDQLRNAADHSDARGINIAKVCTRRFKFRLSEHERVQAMAADKQSYPERTVCIAVDADGNTCGVEWMAHHGYLCPSGDSTFVPLINTDPGKDIVGDN